MPRAQDRELSPQEQLAEDDANGIAYSDDLDADLPKLLRDHCLRAFSQGLTHGGV